MVPVQPWRACLARCEYDSLALSVCITRHKRRRRTQCRTYQRRVQCPAGPQRTMSAIIRAVFQCCWSIVVCQCASRVLKAGSKIDVARNGSGGCNLQGLVGQRFPLPHAMFLSFSITRRAVIAGWSIFACQCASRNVEGGGGDALRLMAVGAAYPTTRAIFQPNAKLFGSKMKSRLSVHVTRRRERRQKRRCA